MKKIFTLLFLTVCFNFYGQVGFEHNTVINDYYGAVKPGATLAIDIDNDGKEDIVTVGSGRVMWQKNLDGQGNFSIGKDIAAKANFGNILHGDIDGDNDTDFVLTRNMSPSSNEIWAVKNNGNGTFSEPVLIQTAGVYADIYLVDMDNDGHPDIVYKNYMEIRWFKNDGQGNFALTQNIISGYFSNVCFSDFTGDGIADMVVNDSSTAKIFENNGDGTFVILHTIDTNSPSLIFTAADIDADGDKDILAVSRPTASSTQITIKLYKNVNGVFDSPQIINTFSLITTPAQVSIYPADIDVDGKTDIICAVPNMNKLFWHKNLGNASFGSEQILSTNITDVTYISVGDINNDAKPDLLSSSSKNFKVAWYKNTGAAFDAEKIIGVVAGFPNSVAAGDLDGDGDIDIVSASHGDNKIAWYKNTNGQGGFDGNQQIILATDVHYAMNVKVIDIDNDGDLDILAETQRTVNNNLLSSVVCFKNDGLANFTKQVLVPEELASYTYNLHYFDIDSDGDIDIIAHIMQELYVYKNNGDGTFAARTLATPVPILDSAVNTIFGDFDNDGDIDIIWQLQTTSVRYTNDGAGNFGNGLVNGVSHLPVGTYIIADINGDGNDDLVCAQSQTNQLSWYANDGNGWMSPRKEIVTNAIRPSNIVAIDIDGDGDLDLVANSQTGTQLAWYQNDGLGNFSPAIEVSNTALYSSRIVAADINADGKMDIVTSSYENNSVNWFKNAGALNNTITGTVRFDFDSNGCTAADAGVPQVMVTTQNGSNTLSTFTNANGGYTAYVGQGTFTTGTSSLPGFNATLQSQQSIFANNSGGNNTANFCLQAIAPSTDLEVNIYRLGEVRPGFPVQYRVVVKNNGTTQVAGSATVNFDNAKLNFNSAAPLATSQTGNTFTFDLSTILPFAVKEFAINFTAKTIPTISLGDEVVLSANVAVANDATPANNTAEDTAIVVGAYDPNDIAVREGSQILLEDADEYLHYLIRFQNTGNYYAERVVVKNPLDSKLDWTTMQIEGMSHTGRAEIINGAEATFTFDAIYLPAMTVNEPASHGYIAYKIKPKANVALGDTFTEQAHIYFDFNPAIDTNIVTTTIVDNVNGIPQFTAETVSVYPVPSKAVLNVKANSDIAKIEIYNQAGQRVLANTMQNSIDISALSHGIYFAKIENVHGSSVIKKVVKN